MTENKTSMAVRLMNEAALTHKGPDGQELVAQAIAMKYFKMEEILKDIEAQGSTDPAAISRVDVCAALARIAINFDPLKI